LPPPEPAPAGQKSPAIEKCAYAKLDGFDLFWRASPLNRRRRAKKKYRRIILCLFVALGNIFLLCGASGKYSPTGRCRAGLQNGSIHAARREKGDRFLL